MKFISSKKGSSTVVMALLLTFIFGCASLVVDMGYFFLQKSKLSSTVDAAALAGVQELPLSPHSINNIVTQYLNNNLEDINHIDIQVDDIEKTIEITASKTYQTYFARVLGINSQVISSNTKAIIQNISSISGARPLAIVKQDFEYGKLYTLKEGADGSYDGNFNCISLGSSGSSTYTYNLQNGYDGVIGVGDIIQTEPGNMSQPTITSIEMLLSGCNHAPVCTYTYYNKHCTKIIFVPVVNTLQVSGKSYVEVMGFATFFLEDVNKMGGHTLIKGRFLSHNAEGETSPDVGDFGTYGIRLIK